MSDGIRYEICDRVGVITFDRPEALNALRRDMVLQLGERLSAVEQDGNVRALMLTGAGRAFCAGVDLKETGEDVAAEDQTATRESLRTLQDITRRLMRLPVPTIAALNGLAVGMGSEMSIACDIRVAAPSAYLWFSEAKRSLFQSNGVMYLLPRMIGYSRSLEWMMSARKIDSRELLASGLVTHVLESDDFQTGGTRLCRRLSPATLRSASGCLKSVGQRALSAGFEEVLQMEVDGMEETIDSPYLREGLAAFAENREPDF